MQGILIILTFLTWIVTFIYVLSSKKVLSKISLVFAFFLYFIPIFYLPVVSDVALFETVGVKISERTDFYAFDRPTHGTYPFLPFMLWFYTAFHLLSKSTGLDFVFFVRVLMIAAVFANTIIIGKILKNSKKALYLQSLFLFNPVNFLVISLHGQVDLLLTFFALLALWVILNNPKSNFYSGVSFGISVLVKSWSIIFLPLFATLPKKPRFRVAWILGFIAVISVFILFYLRFLHSRISLLVETVASHAGGNPGYWGTTGLLSLIQLFLNLNLNGWVNVLETNSFLIIFLSLVLGYFLIFLKKMPKLPAMIFLILIFLAVTPGWGLQYTSWVIPFAAAGGLVKKLKTYSILASVYLTASYFLTVNSLGEGFYYFPIFLGIFVWIYIIFWLYHFLKSEYGDIDV